MSGYVPYVIVIGEYLYNKLLADRPKFDIGLFWSTKILF